jgi:hypothetical protein
MSCDPYTEYLLSGQAKSGVAPADPAYHRVALHTLHLNNRDAWREIRRLLQTQGVAPADPDRGSRRAWDERKRLRAEAKAKQREKSDCACNVLNK